MERIRPSQTQRIHALDADDFLLSGWGVTLSAAESGEMLV
jgi:hypothetical protein